MAVKNQNNKNKNKISVKKDNFKEKKVVKNPTGLNSDVLLIVTFFTGVLLIIASYAWLSVSTNVKIRSLDLVVSSESGLFISLDGINFSDSVQISIDSVINDLKRNYPNHTNQWAAGGLWPVSSNGIKNSNSDKFSMYIGELSRVKPGDPEKKRYLTTSLIKENNPNGGNAYIAFDLFLKNVSGSPRSDNLYLGPNTSIVFQEGSTVDTIESMEGVLNSMRIGVVRIGSVNLKSSVNTIQNIKCNNVCQMFIYEPHSTSHSPKSIENMLERGFTLVDGQYTPTYAIINEGNQLKHTGGHIGSIAELDTEHFALQDTITETDFDYPLFTIPNGVTKLRAYIWIEGQDIDSLETSSKGATISIAIDFEKDLAGYY